MTKEQLNEFKEILEKRKAQVEKEIENLRNELESFIAEDAIDDMEDMAQLENLDMDDVALLKRLEEELVQIKKALVRIENGTFGKCKDGTELPIEKLKANPLAEC
ncbi:TraR/DksA family transcriptional regulator [Nitrosophilus alvini]|uniref:TraR/DksA family transcriptional regulator n=1 Tax=Nitrosophilus alvini TaxID=2714855 RepID=UPI0019095234|nr:TraR/DksA family transcriptional regulator [Nitrosophilus alvini]